MSDRAAALGVVAERVRRLTPEQRALLAEHLGTDAVEEARHLVAYVALAPHSDATGDAIRAHVAQYIPDPLVPEVVVVDALPRDEAGKLDTRRLDGAAAAVREARPLTPPTTPTEVDLMRLWRQLLPVDRIGADDNFFEVGGHSLLATRLMSRVRAAFGVEVPLRRLFEAPTVNGLARAIDEARASGESPAPAPIVRLPRG